MKRIAAALIGATLILFIAASPATAGHPKPDPQPSHGQDCLPHGNGGINEDHCEEATPSPTPTATPTPTPTPDSTPEPTPSATPTPIPTPEATPTPLSESPSPTTTPEPSPSNPDLTLPPTDMVTEAIKVGEVSTAGLGFMLIGLILIAAGAYGESRRHRRP